MYLGNHCNHVRHRKSKKGFEFFHGTVFEFDVILDLAIGHAIPAFLPSFYALRHFAPSLQDVFPKALSCLVRKRYYDQGPRHYYYLRIELSKFVDGWSVVQYNQ